MDCALRPDTPPVAPAPFSIALYAFLDRFQHLGDADLGWRARQTIAAARPTHRFDQPARRSLTKSCSR
jgi:hypothetical protein